MAMAIAEHFPVEIISVDSAQVYRGLDIGTAKPGRAERSRVVHHLIDILEPDQPYSAARFAADARALIVDIGSRGRIPLLVGGTMLYARALRQGLHALPGANEAVRRAIDAEAIALGWPALHARLSSIDPATAARLAPLDSQRIQRALEVWMVSGRTLSEWLASPAEPGVASQPMLCIALEPSDRAVLHQRIEARFQSMLDAGLIDEVRALRERPTLHALLPSMRSVGYRQVWEWLDQPDSMETLLARGGAATRQLAKRQLTWLRRDPERTVIDCLAPEALDQTLALVERYALGR